MGVVIENTDTTVIEVSEKEIIIVENRISVVENGGSSWGGITGDIDLQLDLKNKLDSKEDTSNKSQDIEADKLSAAKFPSIKAIYDWCIGKLSDKVDKITGKGLSTEDYTSDEKIKLSGIEANANNYSLPSDVVEDSSYVHTDNNYTNLEKQNLANQSGTNTGDETQASIITKIGYTPANDNNVVHKTGAETIAGVKTFSNNIITVGQLIASQATMILTSGGFNIIAGLSTVGLGLRNAYNIAKAHIHQDWGNATATYHKFTAGTTTGQTVNDGFDIGITGEGVAQLIQRENLNIEIFTNSVKVGDVSATGVWANNSGTWSTLSDERLKENIEPVTDALEKCLLLSKCVRHYNFKNQVKYATGIRTGYIAQLLHDNGFEGHITYNLPVDEEEGVLLGWKYGNENYFELENEIEVEKIKRIVIIKGEMVLGIENNFVPYLFGAIEELNNKQKELEERIKKLENI